MLTIDISDNSAVVKIRVWNAKNVILSVFSTSALTNVGKSIQKDRKKNSRTTKSEYLKAIRVSSEADAQHIIDVVRSGSSISEIQNVVTRLPKSYHLGRST